MRRILVANRGEIARRVFRTARDMGIQTVAVYSEPDADAPFVREADIAVALRGTTSAETYLDVQQILEAALRSGADAVHPGYGFLSENPDFAQAVRDAGLTWIGPTPDSIRAMALKVEAKRLAADAGVPLVPGAELPEGIDDAEAARLASDVGFPLLVKASAGGGGKGMRVVSSPEGLAEALASARREAQSAFGDPTVFLERYLSRARHVEVQVFGDEHGTVVHLGERECSIQRRHQKVVEESPSPGLESGVAERMYAAAVSLAGSIGYLGAGTVEFMVAGSGDEQEFFFLEMNTRLQVEHPVTEMVTGLDLVEWQIAVARGERLPLQQDEITRSGHAIEVRLYAEDPARGYLPNTGVLREFTVGTGTSLRVDSGVEAGSAVTAHYDPMLAKVISHAPDRDGAAALLAGGLRRARIHGLVTNRDSLVAILESRRFLSGDTTTAFLEDDPGVLDPRIPSDVRDRHLASVAAHGRVDIDGVPAGWRNVPAVPDLTLLRDLASDEDVTVATLRGRDGLTIGILDGTADPFVDPARDLGAVECRFEGDAVVVVLGGLRATCAVASYDDLVCVDDGLWSTQWRRRSPFPDASADAGAQGPSTPVPGTVTLVEVSVGDRVSAGQTLVVLEAMKMEHRIAADIDGVVAELLVSPGQSVDAHAVVAVLAPAEESA